MIDCICARMILSALPQFGPVSIGRLAETYAGRLEDVFSASEEELRLVLSPDKVRALKQWRKVFDLDRERVLLERFDADYRIPEDSGYPEGLKTMADPPVGLYVRGRRAVVENGIAIVGTRHLSQYGRKWTREFAQGLVAAGFVIVSGLARGVDTEAHRAALDVGGQTAAVLGCGLDQLYPPENRELAEAIAESAGVWTEFYFGRKADRQTFPQRNRIVAGMSRATVVIESGERGGSLITARFAMEQGKTVFALPGRVDSPSSVGCHRLIQDGAALVTSVEDVLQAMNYESHQLSLNLDRPARGNGPDPSLKLSPEEWAVLKSLEEGDLKHADQICDECSLQSHVVVTALMLLEIKGLVSKHLDGCYERAY